MILRAALKALLQGTGCVLLIAVASVSAISAPAELLCGADPAMLTPIYPIKPNSSPPELGVVPDVTFHFEGSEPCEKQGCKLIIRNGKNKKKIKEFIFFSSNPEFCRSKEKTPEVHITDLIPENSPCGGGEYYTFRAVRLDKKNVYPERFISISWYQNKNVGKNKRYAFQCRLPSSGDIDVFEGKLIRYKTENNGLLVIYPNLAN